jgi:hypothetical protein
MRASFLSLPGACSGDSDPASVETGGDASAIEQRRRPRAGAGRAWPRSFRRAGIAQRNPVALRLPGGSESGVTLSRGACSPSRAGVSSSATQTLASRRKQQRERRGVPARRVSITRKGCRCCVSTYGDSMVVSVSGAVAEVGSLEKGTRWCRCSPRSHTFEIARFSDVAALAGLFNGHPRD